MQVLMALSLFLVGVNLAYLRFGPARPQTRIKKHADETGRQYSKPTTGRAYKRFAYWAMLVVEVGEIEKQAGEQGEVEVVSREQRERADVKRYNYVKNDFGIVARNAMWLFQTSRKISDPERRSETDGNKHPDRKLAGDQWISRIMIWAGSIAIWIASLMIVLGVTVPDLWIQIAAIILNALVSLSIFVVALGESYVEAAKDMIDRDVEELVKDDQEAVQGATIKD